MNSDFSNTKSPDRKDRKDWMSCDSKSWKTASDVKKET